MMLMPSSTGTSCGGRRKTKAKRSMTDPWRMRSGKQPASPHCRSALEFYLIDCRELVAWVELHVLDFWAVRVSCRWVVKGNLSDLLEGDFLNLEIDLLALVAFRSGGTFFDELVHRVVVIPGIV